MAPPPATAPALDFAGAYLRHDPHAPPALAGISARIAPGKVTLVMGPTGAGKTTLLRLAAGQPAPQAGSVALAGRDLRQYDPHALAGAVAVLPAGGDWAEIEGRAAVLYLLDDPLPEGGPQAASRLRAFIAARRGTATIVIATHDTTLAEAADEAIVLDRGTLAYAGPVKRPAAAQQTLQGSTA
jgi:ABC-type multidrug transport system ATPase subunit